jgi:SAM-dependent methyltransferase
MAAESAGKAQGTPGACPICTGGPVRFYCHKEPASYYACRACGLIFQHPLPEAGAMQQWADAEYASGAYQDYVAARAMKLGHFEARLRDLDGRLPPGRLLDIGCSCGYFLEVAAAHGFDVRGVEFSRSAIAAASPAIRPRIFEGTLDAMPADGLFDVVSAFDLIEHVPDPRAFLRRCAALLKPGGTLLISTPDTDHLLRFVMRSRWPMLQPMQHLFLFSRRSFESALRAEGFGEVAMSAAYKTLSFDYLIDQIQSLNPVLSRTLGALGRVLPASVRRTYRRVNIGEFLAVARRSS